MKARLTAALCLLMATSLAYAGLISEEVPNPIGQVADSGATGGGNVKIVGGGAVDRVLVHGFGRSVPLVDALPQIVPKGYSIRSLGIGESIKVDWQGGRDWISVLGDAVESVPGVLVEVDPNERFVSVKIIPSSSAVDVASGTATREWQVRTSDAMLSSTLKRWGQDAGYQVVWDAPKDFPVMAEAIFAGRFEDAVSAVIESLATSSAPVRAIYYTNKVVRIVRYDGQTTDLRR